MSDKLLTLDEVCKLLDKPEVTVKRYARESLLPSVKKDGQLMFPEASVQQYISIEQRLKK
ncbi:MAG: helix-turn-helix domain-containing protein [Hahellaceae bacterium]|nr:helix-turn-helix domain-containing protein [Hahellaceae bacterium]MCP5210702.1 helix-turn-helix domain-containing protein [Hahellaceae bacterium]